MQMLLACGAFVMSEKITPNKYLRPGVDYIEVAKPAEMFNQAVYYLEHEEERNMIAQNGRNRVRELLDSKKTFSELLRKLEHNEYPRFAGASRHHYLSAYSRYLKIAKRSRNLIHFSL